jgi:hypothetical protein
MRVQPNGNTNRRDQNGVTNLHGICSPCCSSASSVTAAIRNQRRLARTSETSPKKFGSHYPLLIVFG